MLKYGKMKSKLFALEQLAGKIGYVLPFKWLYIIICRVLWKIPRKTALLLLPFVEEFGYCAFDRKGKKEVGKNGMFFDLSEKCQRTIYTHPVYERGIAILLKRVLKSEMIFVDVGANVGYYSVLAAKAGANVLAFEPDVLNFNQIRRNIQSSGYRNVQVFCKAVGKEVGEAVLHVNPLNRGGNTLVGDAKYRIRNSNISKEEMKKMSQEPLEVKVPVVTLDSLELRINVVKIDVEGFEKEVLEGMKKAKPEYIICELSKENRNLRLEGYECFGISDEGELIERKTRDVVFVRSNRS
jgi:FkbM family methyltransferase